jgi:cyclohexanone monooxygenase
LAIEVPDPERTQIYEAAWGRQSALMRAFKDISSNLDANETAADFVRTKIRQIVRDPEVAERLCPYGYPIGARRICIDTGNYYATYNRENVTLVDIKSDPIVEIIPSGIRTESRTYELDLIVFATGFDAFTGPLLRMNVTGSGGEALAGKWQAGPVTYLGLATAGFPNMFTITGPGSPSVLSNVITSIEQHVEWISDAIGYLRSHGMWTMEASAAAEQSWTTHVNEAAGKTLRVLADSWQLGANIPGKPRVFLAYVGGVGAYRKKCAAVAEQGYDGFILNP